MIAKRTKQLPHWWAYVLVTIMCLSLMVFTWLYYQRGINALNNSKAARNTNNQLTICDNPAAALLKATKTTVCN